MQPEAPKPIEPEATKPSDPEIQKPVPVAQVPTVTVVPAMMTTPLQQESAFNALKPARDIWKQIWNVIIGINFLIAIMFVVFIVLRFTGVGGNEFQAVAIGTPFWMLPVLLLGDLAAVVVYAIVKRPKLIEAKGILTWLGIALGAVFISAIGFVVYASMT